jgi:hypothetical protein
MSPAGGRSFPVLAAAALSGLATVYRDPQLDTPGPRSVLSTRLELLGLSGLLSLPKLLALSGLHGSIMLSRTRAA